MPGIVAIVEDSPSAIGNNESLLESMAYSIHHEKWYKTDMYSNSPLHIARVHLGITNAEPQPIFNENESICIFMDGEVFGYEEEKKKLKLSGHKFEIGNDPEFCLHLFEEYGEKFVEELNGSYVVVIYDLKNQRILIANDRHGLRPLYYARIGQKYLFASEVKAILQDRTFSKEIDHSAVAEFFAFDRILEYKTFFKGINVLPPASIIVLSKGKCNIEQYWDFKFKEEYSHTSVEEYYAGKLVRSFRKAVQRRMKGKHHFGVFLSGGLDSRCVVAEISKQHNSVYTFTYGVQRGDEAGIAQKVARKSGTKHTFLKLERDYLARFAEKGVYLTDGMCNCRHFYWISSILKRTRENADIIFHGLGIGWLAAPYLLFVDPVHRKLSSTQDKFVASLIYRKLNTLVTDEMMPHFFSNTYYQRIKSLPFRSLIRALRNVPAEHPVNKHDCFLLRIANRYQMGPVLLRSGLEERVPGFDNDFVDTILEIPPELRLEHRVYYKFFTLLAPDLAKIPYQRTGVPPMAPVFIHRIGFLIKGGYKIFAQKLRNITRSRVSLPISMGYPDHDELIRKDKKLRRFFKDILLDEKTMNRGYFNREYITQMVKEHMSGKKEYGKILCALLTFELWHRLFVDPP